MDRRCLIRGVTAGIVLLALVNRPHLLAQDHVHEPVVEQPLEANHVHEAPGHLHNLINAVRGYVDPENTEIMSMHQLACLIDHLDKSLHRRGQVAVKAPDIWGQNRMTQYRAEFEEEMKNQRGAFESVLSAYLFRSDQAALTSATTVAAAIQPGGAAAAGGTATATAVAVPGTPGIPGNLVANANTLIGSISKLLTPSDLASLTLANSGAQKGIGIEPTILLDQRARYLNHLHELRRINAGDDSTDMPGYGLYLMRMPVSLLPGPESQVGKGASVTVEAKFEPTTDLLPVTFRNVVILDTTYQLKDFLVEALHGTIDLSKDPAPMCAPTPGQRAAVQPKLAPQSLPSIATLPGKGAISATEIIDIYGRQNLGKVAEEIANDQKDWYRHDPSVLSWLVGELTTAHNFIRDEARRGDPWFQPAYIQALGELAFQRRYGDLKCERIKFLNELIRRRTGTPAGSDDSLPQFHAKLASLDVLTFGLLIQSFYLDRTIKIDMEVMARRRGCACGDPWALTLYDPDPDEQARTAFSAYVACKWPIHVFALDPAVDQQNQLDLFSARSELQLALAVAVASGQVNFNNATTYARRLETDLATIALNRTAVGFGAGHTTFGWRFYPRVQTPPTQSNPQRIAGLLWNNGPNTEYDLRNRRIEPGNRECVALIVAPNFVPQIKLTSTSNWFDITGKHAEQTMETTDMVRMARKLQTARTALNRICDTHAFPPNELELLSSRLDQLEALLPMRGYQVGLPFEGDLTASEIFSSSSSALAPRLLTWYGEPPKVGIPSSIFVVGTGFSIHELKAIAGGVTIGDADTVVMSRNVLRIVIPADARPILTNKNLTGDRRLVFDVHVASPNGVSNHLLVEADPPDQPATSATPATSAYSIDPNTPSLTFRYVLERQATGTFTPKLLSVVTDEVRIKWNSPMGTAPKKIQVLLKLHRKSATIIIPLSGTIEITADPNESIYKIDKDPGLNLIAKDYIERLASQENFDIDHPLPPSVSTDNVFITPVSGDDVLTSATVSTDNQLMIEAQLRSAPAPAAGGAAAAAPQAPVPQAPALPRAAAPVPAPHAAPARVPAPAPIRPGTAVTPPAARAPARLTPLERLEVLPSAAPPAAGPATGATLVSPAEVVRSLTSPAGVAPAATTPVGGLPAVSNAAQQAAQSVPSLVAPVVVTTSPPVVAPAVAPATAPAHKARQSVFSRLLHRSQ
jgi:hypothetical protein